MNFPMVLKKNHIWYEFNKTTKRINFDSSSKSSRHFCRRFISKSGHLNLQLRQVPSSKYFRFTKDFANTLVALRWRWVTVLVILTNFCFYVIFAGLWMFDAWLSGDFKATKKSKFCIDAARTFTGYLLLSIETITTTGYGYLYPTENCYLAWFILTLSTIVMVLIDGAFISVVFLKICKPLRKDVLTLFSRKCVVSLRNGKLCLVFRIDDYLNKHAIDTNLMIFLTEEKYDGEVSLQEIEVTSSGMYLWPTDIVHEINEKSPFWDMTACDFINKKFEIIVTFTGTSLVTSQYSTSKTSYLNEEILWGYRFKSFMEFDKKLKKYVLNENDIFKVVPCDTPLCSAKTLQEIENKLKVED